MFSDEALHQASDQHFVVDDGSLFFQFFLGLGLALLLDKPFYGRKVVQASCFCPGRYRCFSPG